MVNDHVEMGLLSFNKSDSVMLAENPDSIPIEINPTEASKRLDAEQVHFLDCRESFEREIVKIEPSLFIPMGRIDSALDSIPRDKPIVVYCHHGLRSLRVANFLRISGFPEALSLRGGVHAWAVEIDPSLAKY